MAKRVDVRFEGSETVSKAAKKSQGAIDGLNKKVKTSQKIWANSTIAIGAAIGAFYGLTRAVGAAIDAYKIQEQAEAKLRSAILATGQAAELSAQNLIDFAGELQRVTTFGDEATISAMAMLQSLASLSEDGFKQITPLIQDFAVGMSVDLETAASLVGKTLGSTTNALSRYGIQIDATASQEVKLAQLTEELESKFGGMAKALADTATGSMAQMQNAFGDLKEVGGRLVAEALRPVTIWLTNVARNAAIAAENIIEAREEMHRIMAVQALEAIREQFQMPTLEMGNLQSQLAGITEQVQTTIVEMAEAGATAAEIFTARRDIYAEIVTQIETLLADIDQVNEMGEDNKRILQTQLSMYQSFLADIDERIEAEKQIKTILNDRQTAILFINEQYQKTTEYAQEQAAVQLEAVIALLDFWKDMHPEEVQTIRMLEAIADRLWDLLPPLEGMNRETENLLGTSEALAQIIKKTSRDYEILGKTLSRQEEAEARYIGERAIGAGAEPISEGAFSGAIESVISTGLGTMIQSFNPLMGAIQAIAEAFLSVASLAAIFDPLNTILQVMMDILSPLINQILAPLVGVLVVIGQVLAQALTPVLQALAPIFEILAQIIYTAILPALTVLGPIFEVIAVILEALTPILEIVAKAFDLVSRPVEVLANLFSWVANTIRTAIHNLVEFIKHPFRKKKRDIWDYPSFSDVFEPLRRPLLDFGDMLTEAGEGFLEGIETEEGGGIGSTTTIQRVPDIYIYQTFEGPIIGAGGMREFGEFTADALQEYAGIGGRIHIAEAIV